MACDILPVAMFSLVFCVCPFFFGFLCVSACVPFLWFSKQCVSLCVLYSLVFFVCPLFFGFLCVSVCVFYSLVFCVCPQEEETASGSSLECRSEPASCLPTNWPEMGIWISGISIYKSLSKPYIMKEILSDIFWNISKQKLC